MGNTHRAANERAGFPELGLQWLPVATQGKSLLNVGGRTRPPRRETLQDHVDYTDRHSIVSDPRNP